MTRNNEIKPIFVTVTVIDQYKKNTYGIAEILIRSSDQSFWTGGKRAAKWVGIAILAALPFGLLEPFLFMLWGSLLFFVLLFIVGPYLHVRFADERVSFISVRSHCPHCQSEKPLEPYISSKFGREFKVICPDCGQTTRVIYTDKDPHIPV